MARFHSSFDELILTSTGASSFQVTEQIQELWSGYGQILRLSLDGSDVSSVVVKHIHLPEQQNHPRGWNSDKSHQRKVRSYEVENSWYKGYSQRCAGQFRRVPQPLGFGDSDGETLIILEDLDAAGFPERLTQVTWENIDACLQWLAQFHAFFLDFKPLGLWPVGTYWHLDTRPDELEALDDIPLKEAAAQIDAKLSAARYSTFVHGDAKLANFCFSPCGTEVAAVDFQYVGGGCGMKDVAYFIGSCLNEDECERLEDQLLDTYFGYLQQQVKLYHHQISGDKLEAEWRALFPLAWTDFHRFLKGWSPGHWKINSYSEKMAREALKIL
ncbi:MAG: phosphotransferase [Verrucomicrobiota bacterium]